MCCSTGVCGPSVDPTLVQFAADLEWLKTQGVEVVRFNLAQEPAAFTVNAAVTAALQERGTDCLPLLVLDGRVVAEGTFPSRDALAALAGIVIRRKLAVLTPQGGTPCCAPKPGAEAAGSCC
jgi:hypothetical protein